MFNVHSFLFRCRPVCPMRCFALAFLRGSYHSPRRFCSAFWRATSQWKYTHRYSITTCTNSLPLTYVRSVNLTCKHCIHVSTHTHSLIRTCTCTDNQTIGKCLFVCWFMLASLLRTCEVQSSCMLLAQC